MIDLHSHILPGVDDGARTFEDSLEIIRELSEQGVTDIVATPHYINETMYTSSRAENSRVMEQLRAVLADAGIDVRLYLGNELYIDKELYDFVKQGQVATMAGSDYILVELPLNEAYPNYIDILGSLIDRGLKVILAHPERYLIVQDDESVVDELCDLGVQLQCNLGSFTRQNGKDAEKAAVRLAKNKQIFAVGSDIHHPRKNDSILKAQKKLRKYYNERELEQILVTNPRQVLGVV